VSLSAARSHSSRLSKRATSVTALSLVAATFNCPCLTKRASAAALSITAATFDSSRLTMRVSVAALSFGAATFHCSRLPIRSLPLLQILEAARARS